MLAQTPKSASDRPRRARGRVGLLVGLILPMVVVVSVRTGEARRATQEVPEPQISYIQYFSQQPTDEDLSEIRDEFGVEVVETVQTSDIEFIVIGVTDNTTFHERFLPTQLDVEVIMLKVDSDGNAETFAEEEQALLSEEAGIEFEAIEDGTALVGRASGEQLAFGSHCVGTITSLGVTYYLETTVITKKYKNRPYASHTCRYSPL